ncbi:hypothetical protein Btru_046964 [Bulinus truncatus]|nr:hypothetical protein Btru_046964 [Bulinus truncatus]
MDDYTNIKQGQFKLNSTALTMSTLPMFSSHPAIPGSDHFQSSTPSATYRFTMDSMTPAPVNLYGHPTSHHQVSKVHQHQLEPERQMNHGFVKPPVTYGFHTSCTTNGFFNSDIHNHSFEDVLNSQPSFTVNSSMNADILSKLSYHQTPNTIMTDLVHYSQEGSANYIQNVNKPLPQQLHLADQKNQPQLPAVFSKPDSDTSSLQTGDLSHSHNEMNSHNQPVSDCHSIHRTSVNLPKEDSKLLELCNSKNIYKCGLCEMCLSNSEMLICHVNGHTSFMPYHCGICSMAFIEGNELMEHVSTTHSVKAPYACGLCQMTFYHNKDLNEHIESHLQLNDDVQCSAPLEVRKVVRKIEMKPITQFKGEETDEDYDNEEDNNSVEMYDPSSEPNSNPAASKILIGKDTNFSLRKGPSKIVMDDVDLSKDCTIIVEPSSAGGVRKKHLFKCNYCEKVCKDKGSLVSHIRTHTKGRPYECETCHATFKQYAHLSDHVMTKHTKERPFVCDRCAKSFNRKSHLQDHIRLRHTEDKLYHCSECSATFQKRTDYSDHKRTHGKAPKYQCNMCPRQFRNVTDYERHIRSHTKEKCFECEVCHLTFGLLANAKKHMVKHSEDRPFKCEICPKAYHFEHDYKRHLVTHKHKKPFPCPDCYKSFKNDTLLKKHAKEAHMKVEEDPENKPFTCVTCKKRFKIQWDLDRHRKIHAKKKPFPCLFCYKTYGSEAMLSKHARVHDGQNLPLYDHSKDIIEDSDNENQPTRKKSKAAHDKESKDQTCEESDTEDIPIKKSNPSLGLKRRGRPPKQKDDSGFKEKSKRQKNYYLACSYLFYKHFFFTIIYNLTTVKYTCMCYLQMIFHIDKYTNVATVYKINYTKCLEYYFFENFF